jgi:hypothetical protein
MKLPDALQSVCGPNGNYKLLKKRLTHKPTGHFPLVRPKKGGKSSFE